MRSASRCREKHGIGRYIGLRSLKVSGVPSEFLSIEYKGGDKLYVPIFEMQQVQKYMGAEGKRPALSGLDSPAWERIKAKVKEDVAKLAQDLLRQAAKRQLRSGYAFLPRNHMEEEFAQSFIYSLTPDQEKTLEEVEGDMVNTKALVRKIKKYLRAENGELVLSLDRLLAIEDEALCAEIQAAICKELDDQATA